MKYCLSFLILFTSIAKAQYISAPYTISTPRGNIQTYQNIYTPMYYSHNNGDNKSNPKINFEVTLKNDSIVKLKSRMLLEGKKLYMVQKEGGVKKKIFPEDTKSCLAHLSANFGLKFGMPADSCWLFKINVGAINCYSSIPSPDINYSIAIQKGEDGKIVALNKENLKEMIKPYDEKLGRLMDKDKFIKAIEYFNEMHKSQPAK